MRRLVLVCLFMISSSILMAATWNLNANGNWNVNANWTLPATFPNGIDAIAHFANVITANRVVSLGAGAQNITIGTLAFDGTQTFNYTIQSGLAGNTLIFDVSAGTASLSKTATNTGADTISCPVTLNDTLTVSEASAGNMTISGAISGAGGLVMTGTGTGALILSAANSYGGTTQIQSGNLTYNANGSIPAASVVTLGDGAAPNATLTIAASMTAPNALSMTINSDGTLVQNSNITVFLSSLQGSGAISLSTGVGNTSLFDINEAGSTTFSGAISGGAASANLSPQAANRVIKEGASTLSLTGTSSYLSRTFIANGVIDVNNAAALGASGNDSGVFVESNGSGIGSLYLNNSINLPKRVLLNGNGFGATGALRNVSGTNEVSGNIAIGWAGGTETASAATIQVDGGTTLTLSGIISGTQILTKSNPGTLIYTGTASNTNSGETIVNAGTLELNKTSGLNALAGNATINSGGTLLLDASNQIINSSIITLNSGGTFNMNGNNETIGSLIFNTGGTFTQGGATLSLNNATPTALTMGDATTISDPLAFTAAGGVTYNGTTTRALISGTVNLGTTNHVFNINDGTDTIDMEISGAISGSGSITKSTGTGFLQFDGAAANTYSGVTTITAGELHLNKPAGVNAIGGNATITSGGTISLGAAEQIVDTSTVTIAGGTFNMNGFPETIGRLSLGSGGTGGTLTQGGALLTLSAAAGTALTMGNGTTISGDVDMTGANSGVTYNGASLTATFSGNLNLAAGTHIFTINNGTANPDMEFSGVISGVGANISMPVANGQLRFSGSASNTYTGTTTPSGGNLILAKTGGAIAIAGDVVFNDSSGTVTLAGNNQISDTSFMDLTSGTFNMAGFSDTIGSLAFNSGTLTQAGGTLSLAAVGPATALSMRNTTISGPLVITNGGTITFNPASGGTATISGTLNLSATTPTFDIPDGPAAIDMNVSGAISSSGAGVTKTNAGTLEFSGSAPNTYSGLTTVSAGELLLAKTAGTDAIFGDILINGGLLTLAAPNQIADTSTMTLSSGTFDMAGNAETIGSLDYQGGTLTQGGATLTLASATTALTMRDTTISGNLSIPNGGAVVFDNTNDGTATISGNVDLGGTTHLFDIADGTATFDMTVSGIISNGAITKIGSGTLLLTGANTYSGGTLISAGTIQGDSTSLQGNITDNANLIFDQSFTGTYSGSISGTGTLDKEGTGTLILSANNPVSGAVTVNAGTLLVDGALSGGGTMSVASGATLGGSGTITKDTTISGILSPGDNGIDTLRFVGAETLASGSTLNNDISPTATDLVSILGTLSISSGSTLNILPQVGNYTSPFTYTLIHTTGGVSGTFSTVNFSLPLFAGTLTYTATDVLLRIIFSQFSRTVMHGNAAAVAECLDELPSPPGSDLAWVINSLRMLPTMSALIDALDQMQPSAFTALAVAQENATLYMRNALYDRLEEKHHLCGCGDEECGNIWATPIGSFTSEDSRDGEPGFNASSPGIFVGLDSPELCHNTLGLGAGYTYTSLRWKEERGDSHIQSVYGALYGNCERSCYYLEGALMGGYDFYSIDREIDFGTYGTIYRTAESHHEGAQGSLHLKGGLGFDFSYLCLTPFVGLDYLFLHENGFTEDGANSLNLKVKSKNSDLLVSELGVEFAGCSEGCCDTEWAPFLQLSVIRESRLQGRRERAFLDPASDGGCLMNVNGLYPSRTLGGVVAGINTEFCSCSHLSLFYRGKFGSGFRDNSLSMEYRVSF